MFLVKQKNLKGNIMLMVMSADYLGTCKLRICLSNGVIGLFDVSGYISKGFFKELSDDIYLQKVKVDSSGMGIYWPNGQDFSANTLEAELQHIEEEPKYTLNELLSKCDKDSG